MSQLSTASLAEAFDKCYLTDAGYKLIYDELMPETFSSSSYDKNLRTLGYVDLDSPSGVNIYVSTFAARMPSPR